MGWGGGFASPKTLKFPTAYHLLPLFICLSTMILPIAVTGTIYILSYVNICLYI